MNLKDPRDYAKGFKEETPPSFHPSSASRGITAETSSAIASTSSSSAGTGNSTVTVTGTHTNHHNTRLATTAEFETREDPKLDYNQNHIYTEEKLSVSGVGNNNHIHSTGIASNNNNYNSTSAASSSVSSESNSYINTNNPNDSNPHSPITYPQSLTPTRAYINNSQERKPQNTDVNEDKISALSFSKSDNHKQHNHPNKKSQSLSPSPLQLHFEKHSGDGLSRKQHPLPPQFKKYPTTPVSKMSASSRRKSRLRLQQQFQEEETMPQERRRNFSFMRQEISPRRRRVSSATLEKTRAHAKKLARLAASNNHNSQDEQFGYDENQQFSNVGSLDSQYSQGGSRFKSTPTKPSLNFSAFETDSCISANTSVYDMDFIDHMPSFDDTASSTSFFSNASTFSTGSSSITQNNNQQYLQQQQQQQYQKRNKNKLDMYNGVNRSIRNAQFQQQQQQYSRQQQSFEMFPTGDSLEYSGFSSSSGFQPSFQQQQLALSQQQQQLQLSLSHNQTLNRSNISAVSNTSSTISGAAARRLMRRGLSQNQNVIMSAQQQPQLHHQQMQQQQQQQPLQSHNQSSGSVISGISEADASQYSLFEASTHSQNESQQLKQPQNQLLKPKNEERRPRPPLSPVPFHPDGSVKPSNRSTGGGSAGNNSNSHSKSSSKSKSSRKSSRKKKKIFIESSAGFTFDAFGLDPNEIDNEVNAAMKELEDDSHHLDLSLFTGSEDCSTSSGSSSVIAIAMKAQENYSHSKQISTSRTKYQKSDSKSITSEQTNNSEFDSIRENEGMNAGSKSDLLSVGASVGSTKPPNEYDLKGMMVLPKKKLDKKPDSNDVGSIEELDNGQEYNEDGDEFLNVERPKLDVSAQSPSLDRGFFQENSIHHSFSKPWKKETERNDKKSSWKREFNEDNMDHEETIREEVDETEWDASNESNYFDDKNSLGSEMAGLEPELKNDENNDSMNSSDSGEVQQFQPRKVTTKFAPMSESQKRAQEWASQRVTPILVSPLLVPKKFIGVKKKETASHKRAKEWADDAPRDIASVQSWEPQEVEATKQQLLSPMRNKNKVSHKNQYYKENWQKVTPSPPQSEVHREMLEQLQSSPSRVKVLPPVQNVSLRKTETPIDGKSDYDKFKSAAPTVSLRKVEMPPRPNKNENNSKFLATVKLRKTTTSKLKTQTSPSQNVAETFESGDHVHYSEEKVSQRPQEELASMEENKHLPRPLQSKLNYRQKREIEIEEEGAKQSQTEKELKGADSMTQSQRIIANNEQNESLESFRSGDIPENEKEDETVSIEDMEHQEAPTKPKLTYRQKREMELREEEAKRLLEAETEEKGPDVATLIRRRIAANKQNLKNENKICSTVEKKEENNICSFREKLRPVSPREVKSEMPEEQNREHVELLRNKLRPVSRQSDVVNHNHDTVNVNKNINVSCASDSPQKSSTDHKEQIDSVGPSNSLQCQETNNGPVKEQTDSVGAVDSFQDHRQKGERHSENVIDADPILPTPSVEGKVIKEDESSSQVEKPGFNSVAALFAQRSAMMKPTQDNMPKDISEDRASDTTKEEPEPSINNVAALFQKRASAMKTPSSDVNDNQANDLNDSSDLLMQNDNSKVLEMFAKRSEAIKEIAKPQQSKMITVGENAIKDTQEKTQVNVALQDDPKYTKYFKMLKMGLPMGAVKNALQRDGLDPNIMDGDHSKPVESEESSGVPLKDDPKYTKYFKMLKMGLPMGAVKNAMERDGLDPDIMDGDHSKPAKTEELGVPLKDDPKYAKYFKMLKMGLPMGAVKNAMERDGENPALMDKDHNLPASSGSKEKSLNKSSAPLPKDKYRRTRLHWDTLRQVRSTSVWALVNQDPDVEQIEIDENEFAKLFQAEMGTTAITNDVDTSSKKKNAVKVIDPKRANNGGIILARLKVTYEEMAVAIDRIDETVMSLEQMQGILEYIPTKEEKIALRKYMTSSDKDSADAFDELCECEKFMVAMMTVKHSKEKVRALLFKLQFKQCMDELGQDVIMVEKSCDELHDSVRLRKLLGIVLNIGNRLNTAGPTRKGKAGAFTIESLLKLSQAKAFDKKTTFLHYIVMVVRRNNETLVNFKNDLPSVLKSDKIYWDQCENDLEEVENQLENVRKIALHEVYGKKRTFGQNKGREDDDMSQGSMTLEAEVEALRSTKIGLFTLDAIKRVSSLRENVERTKRKFIKLLEYFGEEDKKKMSPHELFKIIVTFSKDFDGALEEVEKLEKLKRKTEKKKVQRKMSQSVEKKTQKSSDNGQQEETSSQINHSPIEHTRRVPSRDSTPNRPLRISAMQPHVTSLTLSKSNSKEGDFVKQVKSESPINNQSNSIYENEYPTLNHKQLSPPSPSDDSISRVTTRSEHSEGKNLSNKTVSTTRSDVTSDNESQPASPVMNGDENAEPNFSISEPNLSGNHEHLKRDDRHSIGNSFDESTTSMSMNYSNSALISPIKIAPESPSLPISVGPSINRHQESSDHKAARKISDRHSIRHRARALRHKRVISQRYSPKTLPQTSMKHDGQSDEAQSPSPDQTLYKQSHNDEMRRTSLHHPSNENIHNTEKTPRRKPPTPEGLRAGRSPAHSSTSDALSISQDRIRSRRERMVERRRRIESS